MKGLLAGDGGADPRKQAGQEPVGGQTAGGHATTSVPGPGSHQLPQG